MKSSLLCRYQQLPSCRLILVFLIFGLASHADLASGQANSGNPASVPASPPAAQDLPDESHLPGDTQPSVVVSDLPDESVLPVAADEPVPDVGGQVSENDPTATERPSAEDAEKLPSEAELPPIAGSGADQKGNGGDSAPGQGNAGDREGAEAGEADPLGLENSLDNRPWLRLVSTQPVNLVRALTYASDGSRLAVAGDDKSVFVYSRMLVGERPASWQYERTIRWQVQRGPRGIVYATDAAADTLAIAGHSAMGSLGDILLVDPATGRVKDSLMDPDKGNRQRITSLTFGSASNSDRIAAMDMDGRLVGWSRDANSGQWSARVLADDSRRSEVRNFRRFHPVAMLGNGTVVAPQYVDSDNSGPRWRLQFINWDDPSKVQSVQIPNEYHQQLVTAMAASRAGNLLASADAVGHLYLWETQPKVTRIKLNAVREGDMIVAMSFSSDGRRRGKRSSLSFRA